MNDNNKFQFHDLLSEASDFKSDVLHGLRSFPASIPPKYFYDTKGSKLFDDITELPEYYLTRTELSILQKSVNEIISYVGTGSLLIEPGGGSCTKVHLLLEKLKPIAYLPMDISSQHLQLAAKKLSVTYPWLKIHAICIDFTQKMSLPSEISTGTRMVFFPGSSIGNFDAEEAIVFLTSIAQLVGEGGYLLIGADLKKNKAILEAAYDDAAGITAQFNLNLLKRINRELDANFDLSCWKHKAFYNEQSGAVEMHLISLCDQHVKVGKEKFYFKCCETIHTENSNKYTIDGFIKLAHQAGFQSVKFWTDAEELFSIHLLKVL